MYNWSNEQWTFYKFPLILEHYAGKLEYLKCSNEKYYCPNPITTQLYQYRSGVQGRAYDDKWPGKYKIKDYLLDWKR